MSKPVSLEGPSTFRQVRESPLPKFLKRGPEVWRLVRVHATGKCYILGTPIEKGTLAYAPTANSRRRWSVLVSPGAVPQLETFGGANVPKGLLASLHPVELSRRLPPRNRGSNRPITVATKVPA